MRGGRRFGFEHELILLHPELVNKGEGADEIVSFLTRVGVKKTEPYSLIVNYILPKHAREGWTTSALVGHLKYIRDHLSEYLKGASAAGESSDDALAKFRTGLYLLTKKTEAGKTSFARPFTMYLSDEYRPTIPLERLLGVAGNPIKFVGSDYLADATGQKEDDDEDKDARKAWREFFHQIGVNVYPVIESVEGTGTDYCASRELTALLNSENPKIRKKAIEILDRHWTYYSGCLEARSTSRRGYTTRSASQFLQFLRAVKAPSRKQGEFQIGETYRDVDFVRAVFGSSVAYLDADVSNTEFLDTLGVTHRVDSAACIKRLDQLRSAERVSNKDIKLIYRELERLFDKKETYIRSAFTDEPRIYIPGVARWFRSDAVVWESSGAFMDGRYPPLDAAYREHPTFFCQNLGVSRRPKESALIQALTTLDEYGKTHAERKSEALKIYRRLARSFRDEQTRHPGSEPPWLDSLRTEAVFLDHMDRLNVANDTYIGDDVRLAEAFNAHERISLLDVDPWLVPQLQDLLAKCGMQKVSAVAKYRLMSVDGAAIDGEITRRIRQRSNHIMRLVYARAPGAFERANRKGLWKALKSLEVRTVAVLRSRRK